MFRPFAGGCPTSPPVHQTRRPPVRPFEPVDVFGVDFSWDRPDPRELRNAGARFAITYLSRDRTKEAGRDYLVKLSRAGLGLVLTFEDAGSRSLEGIGAAYQDGRLVKNTRAALKVPNHRPVYFAVDFQWQGEPQVIEYFQGLTTVLGRSNVGVYGSDAICSTLLTRKIVPWAFQTYAWSNGRWDGRAQIRQYSNGHRLAGATVDFDRAVWSDFGQFELR